jgi:hypothetical protein
VSCIESNRFRPWRSGWQSLGVALGLGLVALLAGCGSRVPLDTPPTPSPAAAPANAANAPAAPKLSRGPARSWAEYHVRAAQRLVESNRSMVYLGEVPEPLLAIPVIEVELKSDGSVAHINVLRQPSQAKDTTQLAIDAIKRAAPFGEVSQLPKPWRYVEVFLFNEDRQFKPRTLDQ